MRNFTRVAVEFRGKPSRVPLDRSPNGSKTDGNFEPPFDPGFPYVGLNMSQTKKFVCLANSRKNRNRCVAGKQGKATGYQWIRPVGNTDGGELTSKEIRNGAVSRSHTWANFVKGRRRVLCPVNYNAYIERPAI